MKQNKQYNFWKSSFGKKYTSRNNPKTLIAFNKIYLNQFSKTRTEINKEFVKLLPKNISILEIGSNVGYQLEILYRQGFKKLYGSEIQKSAIKIGKKQRKYIKFYNYRSEEISQIKKKIKKEINLVFTTNFLIHLNKKNLIKTINEIKKINPKYIWCMEYFSARRKEIIYRDYKNVLWKDNFKKYFLKIGYKVLKTAKIKYTNKNEKGNFDEIFLLKNDSIYSG
jgi:hypothetical protein